CSLMLSSSLLSPSPPRAPLFPYTTLFRSYRTDMPNATTAQSMVTSRDVGLISLRLRLNILRTCGGHQNRIASAANPRFALGQRRDRPQERGRTLAVNPLSGAILSSVRLCDSARA